MASRPVIQNGEAATMTAATPLGTHCSAQMTPPLPRPIIRKPINAKRGQCAGAGRRSPRARRMAASRTPAPVYRIAPMSAGGMVSRATRMARYVTPQNTQTASHATYADRV